METDAAFAGKPYGSGYFGECEGCHAGGCGGTVGNRVWPALNATLIWALSQVDKRMAWDEWIKNTLSRHAEAYPEIWYGVWSGPDTVNSVVSDRPGETVGGGTLSSFWIGR